MPTFTTSIFLVIIIVVQEAMLTELLVLQLYSYGLHLTLETTNKMQ